MLFYQFITHSVKKNVECLKKKCIYIFFQTSVIKSEINNIKKEIFQSLMKKEIFH